MLTSQAEYPTPQTALSLIVQLLAKVLLISVLSSAMALTAIAADVQEIFVVEEPYIDLRTGPGRGFPVQYSIARGDTVEIIKQRAAWVKLLDVKGRTGWARAADVEKLRSTDGRLLRLSRTEFSDYQQQRLEFGFAGGSLANDPLVLARLGYRLNASFTLETSYAKVTGDFASSDLWMANVVVQPRADRRLSPFITMGYGRLHNDPNRSLVAASSTSHNFYNVGAGVRFYLTRSFVVRADYKRYNLLINDENNDEHNEFSVGLSFFF